MAHLVHLQRPLSLARRPHCRLLLRTSHLRALTSALFSSESGGASDGGHWINESPSGGLTELYVYQPDSETIWPDPALGVFSRPDPRFSFPGHVGETEACTGQPATPTPAALRADAFSRSQGASSLGLLDRPTLNQAQSQTLHSSHDFIHFSSDAGGYVCADLLPAFPALPGMSKLVCEVNDAPLLLKKELQQLFPGMLGTGTAAAESNLSVITMSQKTQHDMSAWSEEMEAEREQLTEHFVIAAKEICARLKSEGFWSDFVDPCSGTPYYGPHTNTTMFETDDKYRLLGFRIEDLGCCKVICHRDFGRNVFVGTIFTNAHMNTGVIEDLFSDIKVELNKAVNMSGDVTTGQKC